MKIHILKSTMCGGKQVNAGDVVEASDKDASYLIGIRKAEPYDAATQTQAAEQPAAKPRRGRRARG